MKKKIIAIFSLTLSLFAFQIAAASSLPSGHSISGYIGAGASYSHTFSGTAGQAVMMSMNESVSSYGRLDIYTPNGSYWTYGYNELHLTLQQTGVYTVVVSFSSPTQGGNYTLHYVNGDGNAEFGVLSSGDTVSSTLGAYDIDSYSFGGMAGEAITLILDESASSYGRIYVYKPDGSYWTYGNNLVHLTLPDSGSYTVVIRFSSLAQQGPYSLHYVIGADAVEKTELLSSETQTATLAPYDMDSYAFSGESGKAVTLILEESVTSYGRIYVYKPDGSYWTYGNNLLHLTLPDSGSYTVVVRYSSLTHQGEYHLRYILGASDVENGELISGTSQSAQLGVYDMDSYYFTGESGEAISLILDESVSSYGRIYIYKPDGSYWTYGNNLSHLTLPDTGRYTVVIRFSSLLQQGPYSIHYLRGGSAVENGTLISGASHTATLNSYDMNSYSFEGLAGEAVTLVLNESVSSYGRIYLYKPDGSYWTYGNNLTHLTLPQSGHYTVVIRYSSLEQNGAYTLHYVRANSNVENGSMSSTQLYYGNLDSYDMDSYTFSGLAGTNVQFNLIENVTSYGRIYFYKPDGSYWTYANNSTNLTLPDTGTYTVVVRYSSAEQQGPYSLGYNTAP